MGCRALDRKQVDEERMRMEAKPLYVAGEKGRSVVEFRFNLKPSEVGDALFVILSGRVQKAVYRGPYRPEIKIEIDDAMTRDKYYDALEFHLLRPEQGQFCIWLNERGEPYWRPGANVDIDFLEEQTEDENGLLKRFNVRIR